MNLNFKTLCMLIRLRPTFRIPKHSPVIIFHSQGSADLVNLLDGANFYLLDPLPDGRQVIVHPRVLLRSISFWGKRLKKEDAYLCALISIIDPVLVITRLHNSMVFQRADKALPSIRFMAIQNGSLTPLERFFPSKSCEIFHSEFACWGEFEIDQYKSYGANVEKFYPVGSLSLSNYLEKKVSYQDSGSFDIALVSEWEGCATPDFYVKLVEYLGRFAVKFNLKVGVACRMVDGTPNSIEEIDWFQKNLGLSSEAVPFRQGEFTSYDVCMRSKVVVGAASSLLREMFGLGRKVLACNLSVDPCNDFLLDGVWSLRALDYEEFAIRLKYLIDMSEESYSTELDNRGDYVMGDVRNISVAKFLRSEIHKAINVSKK